LPIERNIPIVCYVTCRKNLTGPEPAQTVEEKIRQAVRAGADWVQIREKDMAGGQLLALTREAIAASREEVARAGGLRAARIIVNDRLDVAIAAGAAGVHLGGESLPASAVSAWRRAGNLPADFLIGASCHSLEAAVEAEAGGADYIFFGPVFESPAKLRFGPPQGLEKLREVCAGVKIPVIAIGGVDAQNAEACLRAGAAGIAAIRMFQEDSSEKELREIVARLHTFRGGE
jgi:thiamine-phosphate pyrophosphorylase